MGIDTTAAKTPLLNAAEQNIGNSAVVQPQAVPGGSANTGTIIPQPRNVRLLNLQGGSASAQSTSIIFTATRIVGATNPNPGAPGPITGIIEFGNGGRSTSVEFDVPIGPYVGALNQASSSMEPQDGGTIITVPTGVLRVYARYDNRLIAPVLGTNPFSLAQLASVPFFGPGGPLSNTIPAEPVLVQAMAAYFTRHFSRAYKTVYCYCTPVVGALPVSITVSTPLFGGSLYYCLPAFAQSVKVLRQPITAALELVINNGIRIVDSISVASGTTCPVIPVAGGECIIGIRSATAGAGDQVNFLALSCEVGV